jgi:hypothetical protein
VLLNVDVSMQAAVVAAEGKNFWNLLMRFCSLCFINMINMMCMEGPAEDKHFLLPSYSTVYAHILQTSFPLSIKKKITDHPLSLSCKLK